MPGFPVLHHLPEFAWTHVHWVGDAIQPSHPLLSPSPEVFSNESALCIGWPKCWSFSFSISPSSEYSGLVSFRFDWFDLLAVQRTLKSLLQHHNSKRISSLVQSIIYNVVLISSAQQSASVIYIYIYIYIYIFFFSDSFPL